MKSTFEYTFEFAAITDKEKQTRVFFETFSGLKSFLRAETRTNRETTLEIVIMVSKRGISARKFTLEGNPSQILSNLGTCPTCFLKHAWNKAEA